MGHEADATRSEQTCEIWKIMKPPSETGFTLTLLYALPFFGVKFFFSSLSKLAADK
jgi:hypothetical protein